MPTTIDTFTDAARLSHPSRMKGLHVHVDHDGALILTWPHPDGRDAAILDRDSALCVALTALLTAVVGGAR